MANVTATVAGGQTVTVKEETNYPFDETIRFHVGTSLPVSFPLHLRIPAWCERGATIVVNGKQHSRPAGGQVVKLSRTYLTFEVQAKGDAQPTVQCILMPAPQRNGRRRFVDRRGPRTDRLD